MGTTGERGKERNRRVKTADYSSEGNDKECFEAKTKADDGGDRPFATRRRRCGGRPPARCPPNADSDWRP